MTPAETMAFILARRPGATSGGFHTSQEAQITVTWEAQQGEIRTTRTLRVHQGEPVKTLIRRIYPVIDGVGFLGADTEAEFPVSDDVGSAILQALDRLFVEVTP